MGEEIIVSVSPLETRVAVVEQGLLQEIFIERVHARVTVGNIYKGKVASLLFRMYFMMGNRYLSR